MLTWLVSDDGMDELINRPLRQSCLFEAVRMSFLGFEYLRKLHSCLLFYGEMNVKL